MEVNTKKDKKVKKTRKKFGDGCRITEKYLKNIFSCLQLSKLSNLNIESTIHINDQTTPISNIWQLSQLFDVSMETFLKTTDFLHLHSIPLIKHQNSLYIPFIPPSQLLEFLINPKRFYQLYDVFFLSIPKEKQNLFYENHSYICTCLNDSIHNKQSRRLEILDLSIQESIPPSTKIVIKPNNRKNIQVGTFFHEDNQNKIITSKNEIIAFETKNFIGCIIAYVEMHSFLKDILISQMINPQNIKEKCFDTKSYRTICGKAFFESLLTKMKEQKVNLRILSKAIGQSHTTLSLAKKACTPIRIGTALNVAKFLNTTIDDLLSSIPPFLNYDDKNLSKYLLPIYSLDNEEQTSDDIFWLMTQDFNTLKAFSTNCNNLGYHFPANTTFIIDLSPSNQNNSHYTLVKGLAGYQIQFKNSLKKENFSTYNEFTHSSSIICSIRWL